MWAVQQRETTTAQQLKQNKTAPIRTFTSLDLVQTHGQWCSSRGLCYDVKPNGDVAEQAKHFCVWRRSSRSKRLTAIYHLATYIHDCSTTSSFRLTLCVFLPSIWHIALSSFQPSDLHTCTLQSLTSLYIYNYIYNIYLFWGIPPWVYAVSSIPVIGAYKRNKKPFHNHVNIVWATSQSLACHSPSEITRPFCCSINTSGCSVQTGQETNRTNPLSHTLFHYKGQLTVKPLNKQRGNHRNASETGKFTK